MTHKPNIVFRHFQESDTTQWIRMHGIISAFSDSWLFVTNRKPVYKNDAVELVAERDNAIVGFIDVEMEPSPGTLCLNADSRGGLVWEIGVAPEHQRKGIGKKLVREAEIRLKQKDVCRMEFFTRDVNACKFYEKLKMRQISTHYQFFCKPPGNISRKLTKKGVLSVEHIFGICWTDDWDAVKKELDVIYKPPFEPYLCYGYEHRF